MLVQKVATIQLNSQQRVNKLVCISTSTILIIKSRSITLYDLINNSQLSTVTTDAWGMSQQGPVTIMEAVFHPTLQRLLLLLSKRQTQKHQNWVFASTSVLATNTLSSLFQHASYEDNPTKYESMQLQPRIIIFPKSKYFVLLREFYNDSMIMVFQQDKPVSSFFANQENMSEFNQVDTLVSFRSLFDGKILFELFTVQNNDKQKQKKASFKSETHVNKSGVVIAIKKIPSMAIKQEDQTVSQKQNSVAVLAINWRNKSVQYLICNYYLSEIIKSLSITHEDNLLLSYFTIAPSHKMCTLQLKNNKIWLVYQNYRSTHGKAESDCQLYDVDEKLEEWGVCFINEDFIIVNYSQPPGNQDTIQCRLYRNMTKKQAFVRLALSKDFGEGMIETLLGMCAL